MRKILSISFKEAVMYCRKILTLARTKKVPVAVTVVDARGVILCTMAMDDTLRVSPELSIKKAITALGLKVSTIQLHLEKVNVAELGNNYCCFGGGIPVKNSDDIVIGAVGVSGFDTDEADHNLAAEPLIIFTTKEVKK